MNSAHISSFAIWLIVVIFISGCVQETIPHNIYVDTSHRFSIVPPSGWGIDNTTNYALVKFVSVTSGYEVTAEFPRAPEITLKIYPDNISLFDMDASRKTFIDRVKEGRSNFSLIENKSMIINGKKAYSLTIEDEENIWGDKRIHKVISQHIFIEREDNQMFYLGFFTYTPKQFETYHEAFINTVNTLKVIEN